MISDPKNMYWDSCVFIRFITAQPASLVGDIGRYIKDAQGGDRTIYFSTISYAEIMPSMLKGTRYGSVGDFFSTMGKLFRPIEPNPNILMAAGELRDCRPTDPTYRNASQRVIGTADAIHLMTCLHVRDVLGVSDIVFHTLDEGKGKTWEGKCVPLLGFETWYPSEGRHQRAEEVCALTREKPYHPQPDLLSGGSSGHTVQRH